MKLIIKVALVILVSLTPVSAGWILDGKVNSITQRANGEIGISFIWDGRVTAEKIILSDDLQKKEKLAILLTAKSMDSDVAAEIMDGGIINNLTLK